MTAALPEGWMFEEEEPALPGGWKFEDEKNPDEFRDVVGEELQSKGVEPDITEEFERMYEHGDRQAAAGLLSGASFGLTENIPGFEKGSNVAAFTGDMIGSFVPLTKMLKFFTSGAQKLVSKSPYFQKQLGSLANLLGVGATGAATNAIHDVFQGKAPSAEDMVQHGAEWAALDVALQGLGLGGRFATSLLRKSKQVNKPSFEVLNEIMTELKAAGENFSEPERVAAKALSILEQDAPAATKEINIAKKAPGKAEQVAQKSIGETQAAMEQGAKPLELPERPASATERVAEQRFTEEPVTTESLKNKKLDDKETAKLQKEVVKLAEPYQPAAVRFESEAAALESGAIENQIEKVGARAVSEQELGVAIREDINAQLEEAKSSLNPLYKQAEEAADLIMHTPKETVKEAGEKLLKIGRVKTRPEGYNTVIRSLETALEDAGYVIQKDKAGNIEQIIQGSEVPVTKTMELARRLNEIIDYEAIEPTVKNALKSVARAAKQDIRTALKANPDGLAAFELAEAEHGRIAEKFGKDSVKRIRSTEAGDRIANQTKSPTALSELREVLSPQQMLQVEREVLERLNAQSYKQAKKTLREVEQHISKENRKLANEIVEAKNPHNPGFRNKLAKEAILDDMSQAFTTGARPEKTLNLWKTQKGQKLVKETFAGSPNWNRVKSYLESQSFNDMVSSVIEPKTGILDFKKLKLFLNDPATLNNIRMMGGEEAVSFFRKLDTQVKALQENAKLLERFPSKDQIEAGVKKGNDLLAKTKQRNLQKPKESELAKNILKPTEKKPKYEAERGQRRIEDTKKANQKEFNLFKDKAKERKELKEESTGVRGKRLLERMAKADFPIQARTKKWAEWFAETLHLTPKAAMSVFGLMKLGLPNTVATMVGYRILSKMATSPRVRRAFNEAIKKHTDPVTFFIALETLGTAIDED